jgi:hypothetical protein
VEKWQIYNFMVFHSSDCKNYNIEKFTTHFTTWASILVIVKIKTLKNSIHILQHGHVVKVQKSLHASFYDVSSSSIKDVVKHIEHQISNSCTWPSAVLGCLFPSQNWPLWKIYPPKFLATFVFKTTTARRSPMHFRTVGGQDSHVHGALFIGSGIVRE